MRLQPPATDEIGAEITDVDVRQLDADAVAEIKQLVYRSKLVVFRDQHLSDGEYIAVARRFGRPQFYFQTHYHHPEHPEIFVSSNVPQDGQKVGVAGTGRFWHTDYSFFPNPLSMTFVYPKVRPRTSRSTLYIDMQRVLDGLPRELRARIEHAQAFHEATWYYKIQPWDIDRAIVDLVRDFKKLSPGALHPMVIRHPVSGRESLYVSSGFTTGVEGLDCESSRALLAEIFAFVEREEHVHEHSWGEFDLLLWDNRTLIHRASEIPPGEPSVSYRIGIYDDLPFYVTD